MIFSICSFQLVLRAEEAIRLSHTRMRSAGPILMDGGTFLLHPNGDVSFPNRSPYLSRTNVFVLNTREIQVEGIALTLPYKCRALEFRVQKSVSQNSSGSTVVTDMYVAKYVKAIGGLPAQTETMSDEEFDNECKKGSETIASENVFKLKNTSVHFQNKSERLRSELGRPKSEGGTGYSKPKQGTKTNRPNILGSGR